MDGNCTFSGRAAGGLAGHGCAKLFVLFVLVRPRVRFMQAICTCKRPSHKAATRGSLCSFPRRKLFLFELKHEYSVAAEKQWSRDNKYLVAEKQWGHVTWVVAPQQSRHGRLLGYN